MNEETITVKVEAKHIKGAGTLCSDCPVARALRDAIGLEAGRSRYEAMAQPARLFAATTDMMIACPTPPDVRTRIERWDAEHKMEPFEFTVPTSSMGFKQGMQWSLGI